MIKAFAATKPFKSLRNAPKKTIVQLALESLRKLTRSPASIFVPGQGYLQTLDNRLTYSQDLSNAAYVLQGGASKSGQNLLMSAAADGLYHSCTIGVGPITLSYTLSGSGRVYAWGYNATDGTIGLTPIDLTATPTVYVVNITPTVANTTWQIGRTASGTASSVTLGACGEHPGTYTAQQIASLGIPWTMGTASVSLSLGPEKVVNGSFDNDSNWTKTGAPNNWNITGNVLNGVGSGTFSYINNSVSYAEFITGTNYWISVDQVFSGSAATLYLRGSSSVNLPATTGRIELALAAGSGTTGVRFGASGFTGTLDNVSVREILSVACPVYTDAHVYLHGSVQVSYGAELNASAWSTSTVDASGGSSFSNGTGRVWSNDGTYKSITQNVFAEAGQTYRFWVTVTAISGASPSITIGLGGGSGTGSLSITTPGTYYVDVVPNTTAATFEIKRSGAGNIVDATVTGISFRKQITTSTVTSGLLSNNYTLSDGSTGYSAVDGTVGRVLDGAGSVGAELVTNGDFSNGATGWTASPGTQISALAGAAWRIASVDGSGVSVAQTTLIPTVGKTYKVSVEITATTGSGILIDLGGATSPQLNTVGVKEFFLTCTSTVALVVKRGGVCDTTFDNISVREVTGIHATQSTTANKPALRRGATNLFPYGNLVGTVAANTPTSMSVTGAGSAGSVMAAETVAGVLVQPFRLISATSGIHGLQGSPAIQFPVNVPYTLSAYARVPTGAVVNGQGLWCYLGGGTPNLLQVATAAQLNAQPKDVWVRYSVTWTPTVQPTAGFSIGQNSASASSTFDIAVIQVEVGSVASDYSPTTTAAASNSGAGRYSWQFDGMNDSLALGSVPFQMADDHCAIVGMRHTATGAQQSLVTCSSTSSATPLICNLEVTAANNAQAYWRDDASASSQVIGAALVSGSVNVLSGRKVGNAKILRVNGSLQSTDNNTLGTTTVNTSNIGALVRTSTQYYNSGSIGPVIVIKGTVSDADLLTLERWVASLTPNGPTF